ncbi:Hypothetical_protein [Hexamita inflata]|uniref:Hypothetical_protein n=1 Tax=Hexamita inflata TaxID=28002 RepID=A0AA86R002_9EUKA|nr:Hypothetical protein HINF_LOCUS47965 [Hexamita inflata]
MNIVSKSLSFVISNAGQLNIITQITNNLNINDLLVNLIFKTSQGNITLVGSITETVNVNKYQILGCYQSSGSIALLSLVVNQVNLSANNVNLILNDFCTGNLSSYLFSYVSQSTMSINQVSIIIGNISYANKLSEISTTDINQFQYGGIVSYLSNTIITLQQIINDCYQSLNSQFIYTSGQLIGKSQFNNTIYINNICFQQYVNGYNTKFINYFGLIGFAEGVVIIQQSIINISYNITYFNGVGIIGYQTSNCTRSDMLNLITTITVLVQNQTNSLESRSQHERFQ